jgi:hypothetical protein
MKQVLCLCLTVVLVPVAALAGDEKADKKTGDMTDPVAILKKVDAAARAVKAVKYDVVTATTGALVGRAATAEAAYIVTGFLNNGPEKFFCDAKVKVPSASEPVRLTGGTDNNMFFVIDHRNKKAYEDIDPAVMGAAAGVFRQIGMIEFIHPTPFSDEINGKSQELKGTEKIEGEECYVVHVVYQAPQAPQATWYFSKKDFLPRRRVDEWALPTGEKGTMTRTVKNLVVDPKLDENTFKLKLPEGYTKTDDFAPNLFPTQ